jgi:hypothetical protein
MVRSVVGAVAVGLVLAVVPVVNADVLPDGRVYEQVSPVKKNGNNAAVGNGAVGYAVAASDGDGVMYGVGGSMGAAPRGLENSAISHRAADGWTSASAIPAGSSDRIYAQSYATFSMVPSSDLSRVLFTSPGSFVTDNPETLFSSGALYMGHADGTVDWLSRPRIANPVPAPGNIGGAYLFQPVGGSPDLGRVYFFGQPTLLSQDAARAGSGMGGWGLYEYADGVLEPAGTLPDGRESPGGAAPASTQGAFGGSFNYAGPDSTNWQVSRDGSTLLFVSPDPRASLPPGTTVQLYVRRGGHSTLVSRTADGSPAPSGISSVRTLPTQGLAITNTYAYGSADGSTVIFQSVDALAPDAPNDATQKVYRYDVATGSVSYLSGVEGSVVASSDDDQRFLFTDPARIALWDHGQIRTIASVGAYNNQLAPARATASGSVFAFSTQALIPGFNNGGGFVQVYRYSVEGQRLTCVSCPPDGSPPTANASLSNQDSAVFASNGELVPGRGISDDGGRVFFDSPDALVPSDANGRRDVYEWTPSGLSLISSGRSYDNSFLLDNGADGDDVFFATTEGLVAGDYDESYDVYDARVGGGFQKADVAAPCTADSCQGLPSASPSLPAVGTRSLSGSGGDQSSGADDRQVAKARLKLGIRKVVKGALEVTVTVTGPGRVSLAGRGLRSVRKSSAVKGTLTLRSPLTAKTKRALKSKRGVKRRVRVGFTPKVGTGSSVTFVLNVKA